jgi:hypothetical protein
MDGVSAGEVHLEAVLKALGLDQYQRAAQLSPAVLAVLPLTAVITLWAPKASVLVGGLASVVATGAVASLLMHWGRAEGRRVQARILARLGGFPSAIALRHRDDHIPEPLRLRYHAALREHDFAIPTAAEEAADPLAAEAYYRAASDWLTNQTRDAKTYYLLHVENRSYGFRRNLLGLKPTGLTLAILSLMADLALLYLWHSGDPTRAVAAAIVAAAIVAGILAWLFVASEPFVEDAAWAYAVRLLAACDVIPVKRGPTSGKSASKREKKPAC